MAEGSKKAFYKRCPLFGDASAIKLKSSSLVYLYSLLIRTDFQYYIVDEVYRVFSMPESLVVVLFIQTIFTHINH